MTTENAWYKLILDLDKNITAVHLISKTLGDDGVRQIAGAVRIRGNIQSIKLDKCNIGMGYESLADTLRQPTMLIRLSADNCSLGDQGLVKISATLRTNTLLQELSLNGNGIGIDGVSALADALWVNPSLTDLFLGSNKIGNEGAKHIARSLGSSRTTTLRTIRMNGNMIGDKGAEELATCLKSNQVLRSLELWNNAIRNKGAETLAAALKDHNKGLEELNLNCNKIGASGVTELSNALMAGSSSLTVVHLEGNPGRGHQPRRTRVVVGMKGLLLRRGLYSNARNDSTQDSLQLRPIVNGGVQDRQTKRGTEISEITMVEELNVDPPTTDIPIVEDQSSTSKPKDERRKSLPEYIPNTDARFHAYKNARNGHRVSDIYAIQNEVGRNRFMFFCSHVLHSACQRILRSCLQCS